MEARPPGEPSGGTGGSVTIGEATRVWAKIGLLSFGGPAGQIALMHRILVEEKRWIDEERFLHALNFCMLLPGPEAQQLATYVGWMLHRIRGGLIAGTLFVLPGSMVVMGLSLLYLTLGEVSLVQGLFLGLKPAVVVIVLQAMIRIARRSLASTRLACIAAGAFLAMFVFAVPFPLVIGAAALLGYLSHRPGHAAPQAEMGDDLQSAEPIRPLRLSAAFLALWLAPTAILLATLSGENLFSQLGLFFSKMAVVTFGGAYAVLAYVSQEAVTAYGWLSAGEMIDGLALAETTPGPLILVTQFVGFAAAYHQPGSLHPVLAGVLGGALTTWVTFVPCFLWIFLGAPYMERLRRNVALAGALRAVTAAVVGVVLNLALWFATHVFFAGTWMVTGWGMALELPQPGSFQAGPAAIALLSAILLFRFRVSMLLVLAVAGALGIVLTLF